MQLPFALSVLCVAAFPALAPAQTLLRTLPGNPSDRFGAAVIQAGDQNGDGFEDLLVGAPGQNGGRGGIHCVSGLFLALGTQPAMLWSLAPTTLATGTEFGTSLVRIGNLTGNSAPDFVVGGPGASSGDGAIYLVDGAVHTIQQTLNSPHPVTVKRFGQSLGALGDVTGDGIPDLAVGAPGDTVVPGRVYVLSGTVVAAGGGGSLSIGLNVPGLGTALASGFDLDGDGKSELAVGSPLEDVGSAAQAGKVYLFSSGLGTLGTYSSGTAGEHLGQSLDAAYDYNGDGKVDVVAGAPNWNGPSANQAGRAIVLSGAKLAANAVPTELYIVTSGAGGVSPGGAGWRFGAAVRASADLSGDGVGDFLVGMPGFFTPIPIGPGKGGAILFSGATGARIGGISGANNERLGDGFQGAFQDLDGDGFPEFVVAGSQADNPNTDGGTLKCYRLFPSFPTTYCSGKVNSLGCTPSIGSSGVPSASSTAPSLVTCSNVINMKNGLLIYSHQPTSLPFQGGVLCVKTPLRRTTAQNSGGGSGSPSCNGAFAFDFNAWIQTGADPSLVAGAEAFCQYWSRDPQSLSTTSLSNALRMLLNP